MKRLIKEMVRRLQGEQDVKKLINRGLVVGKNPKFMGGVLIDPSHCWHISIGDNVTLAPRVHVLAHDTSTKLFLGFTIVKNVKIGNNVFVGAGSIILPGVTIGDNVVVGAGSVVSHDIPSNSVAVGNPARVVKSLADFMEKNKSQMNEGNCFGEEFTLRNPDFGKAERDKLLAIAEKQGSVFVY
jgi:maltose O-acetyltransferase